MEIDRQSRRKKDEFTTTQWIVVQRAGMNSTVSLNRIAQQYWYPLYAYLRGTGVNHQDAHDYVQGFFAFFLESNGISKADPERGRFRSFLLTSLRHYVQDQKDKANAMMRGGGTITISFDAISEEQRYDLEPLTDLTPEMLYERSCLMALIECAMKRLRDDYSLSGKEELFENLLPVMQGENKSVTYVQIGNKIGLGESGVKSAVHRMRARFRELLVQEIMPDCCSPEDVEEELKHILTLLSR